VVRGFFVSMTVAAAIAVALLAAPGAGAATSCGGHVTVKGAVPCYKARAIVKEFKRTRNYKIQGFKCSGTISGGQVTEVNCHLTAKRIHWKA
jgi:hypothetical protein